MTTYTLILTHSAIHPLAWHGHRLATTLLENDDHVSVFFYQDAVTIANRLNWQSADNDNIQHAWQNLDHQYQLTLPVCVSAALARGITDPDNASRHQLLGENLADRFRLVGLSDMVLMMQTSERVIQL